jgi:hypothetical protein
VALGIEEDHMRYIKMLGLLSVAAVALMALAGTAGATITSPAGTVYNGKIHLTGTETTIHSSVTLTCKHSTIEGTVTNGATTVPLTAFTFNECGPDTYTTIKPGYLRIESNGTVFSEDAEFTITMHRSVLGFPVTTHCLYYTQASFGTHIGTLTEGTTPSLHIGSSATPRTVTDGACGETSVRTGTYHVTTPHELVID